MFETCMYTLDHDMYKLRSSHALSVRKELENEFICDWLVDVQRKEAARGEGLNKLRTYALFKCDFGFEPYLSYVKHEGKRILLFKLRVGIAPLRIETGRYESHVESLTCQQKKGINEDLRICQCCFGGVENEFHFLLVCPIYAMLRSKLISCFHSYCNISNMPVPTDKLELFNAIMKCHDITVICELANYIWDAFKCRTQCLGF